MLNVVVKGMFQKIFISILFFFCFLLAKAQLDFKITYDFNFGNTDNDLSTYRYNSYVLSKQNVAFCYFLPKNSKKEVNNDSTKIYFGTKKGSAHSAILKDYNKNLLLEKADLGLFEMGFPVFSDSLNLFNWVLVNSEKKIDGNLCKKAICIFRKRAYIAWYDPKIPILVGPWKFSGLPGLMVEIYDDEHNIRWKLKSIEYNVQDDKFKAEFDEKPLGNFDEYKKTFKKGAKKFLERFSATENFDPNCQDCGADVKLGINTIEFLEE